MASMDVLVDSLKDNDYTEDLQAHTPYGSTEYVRERGDVLEVVTLNVNDSIVMKERFNSKGTRIDFSEVNVSQPSKMSLALRLTF